MTPEAIKIKIFQVGEAKGALQLEYSPRLP